MMVEGKERKSWLLKDVQIKTVRHREMISVVSVRALCTDMLY